MMSFFHHLLIPFSLAILTTGCAQHVQYAVHNPATVRLDDMRRIAVLNLDGSQEHAARASEALIESVRHLGLDEVVPEAILDHAAPEALRDRRGNLRRDVAVEAGRRMQLDGIVVGMLRLRDTRKESIPRLGYPFVGATVDCQLIELPSGRVRNSMQAHHADTVVGGANSSVDVVDACIRDLARQLAAHEEQVSRELAGSKWFGELSDGNRLAAKQRWREAEASWNEVVRNDTDNDDAWFNLAVAAEARGDLHLAQERYRRALEIDDREDYRLALGRLEEKLPVRQIARRQFDQPPPFQGPPQFLPTRGRPSSYVAERQSNATMFDNNRALRTSFQ